jgi:hypothetical protein
LARERERNAAEAKLADYDAKMNGHPGMCCGQCVTTLAAAEAREKSLRDDMGRLARWQEEHFGEGNHDMCDFAWSALNRAALAVPSAQGTEEEQAELRCARADYGGELREEYEPEVTGDEMRAFEEQNPDAPVHPDSPAAGQARKEKDRG